MNLTNKFWRNFLRICAALAIVVQLIFSILVPKIKGNPVYLDTNDGYVIIGAIALLISIEAVKAAVDSWVNRKTQK